MSSLFAAIIALLGWSYTDTSGIVHTDNCFAGSVLLYEDMSYIRYSDSSKITCIESYFAPYSTDTHSYDLWEIYIVQITYLGGNQFLISDRYYRVGDCDPTCIIRNEYTIDLNRLYR